MIALEMCSESRVKRLIRRVDLLALAERVCAGEGRRGEIEISVLLCDDPLMAALNVSYRKVSGPTDVLSFGQGTRGMPGPLSALGDIVISLETVARRCGGDRRAMRAEVRLLFCHGLLHLLGCHHGSVRTAARMAAKQARYLGLSPSDLECAGSAALSVRFGSARRVRNESAAEPAHSKGGTTSARR